MATATLNVDTEADDLEILIRHCDTMYEQFGYATHPDTKQPISDPKYDDLRKRLAKIRPDSEIFDDVTASSYDSGKPKVIHNPPLSSIKKANGTVAERDADLAAYIEDVRTALAYKGDPTTFLTQSFKRDGVSCALYYENGKLVKAGLRSRSGVDGDDVTEAVKFVKGVAQQLPLPVTLSLRGELECAISVFKQVNEDREAAGEELYKNPRNYTSGSISLDDTAEVAKRGLSFVGHGVEAFDNPPYKNRIERAKWVNQTLKIPFVRVEAFDRASLDKMEALVPSLDYEVDGVVIGVLDLEDSEQMGRHGNAPNGNPKALIAWKFADPTVDVPITGVEANTGRTGRVSFVGLFAPVQLAGTSVKRCTFHNAGWMIRNGVDIGAVVSVKKSGKIIPKADKVVKAVSKVNLPTHCASCGDKLTLRAGNDGNQDLICTNYDACPAQNIGTLVHYLAEFGCKGVAESAVTKLIAAGLIKRVADFYSLTVSDLIKAGFSDRMSLLIVARIHMVPNADKEKDNKKLAAKTIDNMKFRKKIPLAQLIAAIGIPGASKGTGRNLTSHFGTIDKIMAASKSDFESVSDIGEKTADNLETYFAKNKADIVELLKYVEPEGLKTGPLSGKSFVFTGTLVESREIWGKRVEDLGGKVSGSVSKNTDFLVAGNDAGSKLTKATQLGVKVIDEDALKKMM